ncbi:hypothetical protein [Aquimarina pacifica]|uniref:hypothetical protein n=1 Tax=Aquimarina pacifica TaxID=1296415 RepID=UPI000471B3AD|nr:hypothetical protein [Aquimarina pacifica]
MKTFVFPFALGFLLGRYMYLNHTKKEALDREARIQQRLLDALEDLGLSERDSSITSTSILKP